MNQCCFFDAPAEKSAVLAKAKSHVSGDDSTAPFAEHDQMRIPTFDGSSGFGER